MINEKQSKVFAFLRRQNFNNGDKIRNDWNFYSSLKIVLSDGTIKTPPVPCPKCMQFLKHPLTMSEKCGHFCNPKHEIDKKLKLLADSSYSAETVNICKTSFKKIHCLTNFAISKLMLKC